MKETKQPNPTFKQAIETWFNFYKSRTGQQYLFTAKDGNHLKQLIKKVEAKIGERGLEVTEQLVTNSLAALLVSIKDQWILDNLEISIINSKFNVIYSKAFRSNPFTEADRINEIIRDRGNPEGAKKQA